jgi:two-component system sensor histidine kinase KdpD
LVVRSRAERRDRLWYVVAVLGPAGATGLGLLIGSTRTAAAALVYLLSVLAAATAAGVGPGVIASLLSFLGLNFFFTAPRRTFSVAKTDDLIALVVFLSVGLVVSTLVAHGRAQRARAERREFEARGLYAISTRLLGGEDLDRVLADLCRHLKDLFGLAHAEIRTRDASGETITHASGPDPVAGHTVVEIPLATGERDLGAIVLVPRDAGFGEAERRVATIFARQAASALERAALEREAAASRVEAETNRVRRALLSAVSHDFRTPLASIKASITALAPSDGSRLAGPDAQELLRTALEETERLERLVGNLLDLTRIRSGALAPERASIPASDVIEGAVAGLRSQLAGRQVSVVVRPDTPPLLVDPVQIGQVLGNVIENAAKFAPSPSEIRIAAAGWHSSVEIRIADRGPGIPAEEREAVFEEFYRTGDSRIAGTGLGLAVAKAIVRAHGGDVWIEETPGGGTTVALRLPGGPGPP